MPFWFLRLGAPMLAVCLAQPLLLLLLLLLNVFDNAPVRRRVTDAISLSDVD